MSALIHNGFLRDPRTSARSARFSGDKPNNLRGVVILDIVVKLALNHNI